MRVMAMNAMTMKVLKTTLTAVCAAFIGVAVLSHAAVAQQKTAKVCNEEWAANRDAIKAGGKTKRVFVAECRGVPVAASAGRSAAALPVAGQFATEAEAKASCPTDTVVWANPKSRV